MGVPTSVLQRVGTHYARKVMAAVILQLPPALSGELASNSSRPNPCPAAPSLLSTKGEDAGRGHPREDSLRVPHCGCCRGSHKAVCRGSRKAVALGCSHQRHSCRDGQRSRESCSHSITCLTLQLPGWGQFPWTAPVLLFSVLGLLSAPGFLP